MKGDLKMKAYDLETRETSSLGEGANIKAKEQGGSMLLEAIIVLGMIATFTPLLYKHVADRRADIENINRANTLIYLQQKTEEYLKDPDNITALVDELGHNQHKEIYPSELGIGDNFDGRYIIGIRREDEQNKPVLKAMIIDTVNTGSDLRAAKVAELIGVSAGIYTAVDPDSAWGINGMWSEPLSRYFNTTNIPTGAVAVTTEYNKEKYRVSISDILVDSDLDLGEFDLTAEQINAINIAAQNGTIDQLIAQDVTSQNVNATTEVTSPKVSATERFCFKKENGTEDCIESWEGLGGGGGDSTDLTLVQLCNAGMTEFCMLAFAKGLNTSCSKVDAVYDRFGAAYPSTKIYNLTYGSGTQYPGTVRTKCEGTQFVVDNISTLNLSNPVEMVGDSAFGITQPGWYQVTLMGEAGDYEAPSAAGGILIANTYYDTDTLITLKGIKGGQESLSYFAGAGVALWDVTVTTGVPTLVAGGGAYTGGGGYLGGNNPGYSSSGATYPGYGWAGSTGGNTYCCYTAPCNNGATGGCAYWTDAPTTGYGAGGSGTGSSGYPCPSGYTCTTITGGSTPQASGAASTYPVSTYGNWYTNTLTGGKGYASIIYCGTSEADCPATCTSGDSDCPSEVPYCVNNFCAVYPKSGTKMYQFTSSGGSYTIPVAGRYKIQMAASGTMTGIVYYNKGVQLTVTYPSGGGGSAGSGIVLFAEGVPVLAVGGTGWCPSNCYGGGGYIGGEAKAGYRSWRSGYSWDGSLGNSTARSGAGTGGYSSWSSTSSAGWAYGGTGYCASGYSCSGTYGGSSGYVYPIITYCGPFADSTCP